MYHSTFRVLGKKKVLFTRTLGEKFEKGDYLIFHNKTYKVVERIHNFSEEKYNIHYSVGHIPKGNGVFRLIHELVLWVRSLMNKI